MSVRSIDVLLMCDGCGRRLNVEVTAWDGRLNEAEIADALGEQEWSTGPAKNTHWCLACTHRRAAERARRDQAQARAHEAERSAQATRGHLTRLKKRVANGVCPCCRRQFADLVRHMQTQHPDYPKEE